MEIISQKRAVFPVSSRGVDHSSLYLFSLAITSCNFSKLEFTAGASRPNHKNKHAISTVAEFGIEDETTVVDAAIVADDVQLAQGNFPWLENIRAGSVASDLQLAIQIMGHVQPPYPQKDYQGGVVFIDSDANGRDSADDYFIGYIGDEGYFSGAIPLDQFDKNLLAIIEKSDGTGIDLISWRAPSGSSVISPLTELFTLMELSPVAFNELLKLPDDIDITKIEPYLENEDVEIASKVHRANSTVAMVLATAPDDLSAAIKNAFSTNEPCASVALMTSQDALSPEDMSDLPKITEETSLAGEAMVMTHAEPVCEIIGEATAEVV